MDFIASSRKISAWLDAQGITEVDALGVDEFAPKVWALRERVVGMPAFYIGSYPPGAKEAYRYICPYFGPGGSDNSLKALRAYCKGKRSILRSNSAFSTELGECVEWSVDEALKQCKTDGIALHDLLEKLMEEKK